MSLAASSDIAGEITKASPPLAVTGITLVGVPLNEWVLLLTLIYTALQIGWFVYSKIIRKDRDGERE